ncbi:MAG: hypothetical protein HOP07_00030 [Bacteriovoracaceae bacterium]|nr:hypothetical protein [Bacteriovoracaceae bacterium]
MKVLIIFVLAIISFNSFAGNAKVGEDKKGECTQGVQAGRKTIPKALATEPVAPTKEVKTDSAKPV